MVKVNYMYKYSAGILARIFAAAYTITLKLNYLIEWLYRKEENPKREKALTDPDLFFGRNKKERKDQKQGESHFMQRAIERWYYYVFTSGCRPHRQHD